jgi:hypothetical protein
MERTTRPQPRHKNIPQQTRRNIVIDTSAAATDTIDYVASDQSDLTATSTRTVIISSAAQSNTTASTTTAQ